MPLFKWRHLAVTNTPVLPKILSVSFVFRPIHKPNRDSVWQIPRISCTSVVMFFVVSARFWRLPLCHSRRLVQRRSLFVFACSVHHRLRPETSTFFLRWRTRQGFLNKPVAYESWFYSFMLWVSSSITDFYQSSSSFQMLTIFNIYQVFEKWRFSGKYWAILSISQVFSMGFFAAISHALNKSFFQLLFDKLYFTRQSPCRLLVWS